MDITRADRRVGATDIVKGTQVVCTSAGVRVRNLRYARRTLAYTPATLVYTSETVGITLGTLVCAA
jgi:hypothetical protein